MGWANCGTDSEGRPIGYAYEAICDHTDCEAKIDRGLSYVCGDMHGENEVSCEQYFCEDHRNTILCDGEYRQRLCEECGKEAIASGLFYYDEQEGCLMPSNQQI